MAFLLDAKQELHIESVAYWIAEHPAAPGLPYGQEGRQAVVYQLVAQEGEAQALKVFKPRYRLPALVSLADRIAPFSRLPGLQVCRRTVLAPQRHAGLLRQQPDLTYAVLMPWVEGPTWMEVVVTLAVIFAEIWVFRWIVRRMPVLGRAGGAGPFAARAGGDRPLARREA